jgi:hypothetical protein
MELVCLETKYCIACKKEKVVTEFGKTKYGYRSWCKLCTKKYNKEYNEKNKAKLSLQRLEYKLKHKEEIRVAHAALNYSPDPTILEKVCTKCGETKPITKFGKSTKQKDGYNNQCKDCLYIRDSKYRKEHPEISRKSVRKWKKTHPEAAAALDLKYRIQHRSEAVARSRKYYSEHREARNLAQKEYYETHKEEISIRQAEYYLKHKQEVISRVRGYYKNHREEYRKVKLEYYLTHKEMWVASSNNRRAGLRGVKLTTEIIKEIKMDYGGLCPYCNKKIEVGHIDHIIPVSKGGTNARENLAWVCASCNLRKHNKSLLEFLICRMEI